MAPTPNEERQFGWMWSRRGERLGSPRSNLKNGSYELAVVALSTHSGVSRMTVLAWDV